MENQYGVMDVADELIIFVGTHEECVRDMVRLVKMGWKPERDFDLFIVKYEKGVCEVGIRASYVLPYCKELHKL